MVAGHLSRLVNKEITNQEKEAIEEFQDEQLFMVQEKPWFADMANYKVVGISPDNLNWKQKNKFLEDTKQYL